MRRIFSAVMAFFATILAFFGIGIRNTQDPEPPPTTAIVVVTTTAPTVVTTVTTTTAPAATTTTTAFCCIDCGNDCKCAPAVAAINNVCACGVTADFKEEAAHNVNGVVCAFKKAVACDNAVPEAVKAAGTKANATVAERIALSNAEAAAKACADAKHAGCAFVAGVACNRRCEERAHHPICWAEFSKNRPAQAAIVCDNCWKNNPPGSNCCK